MPDYRSVFFPRISRSTLEEQVLTCNCIYICVQARYRGHKKAMRGKGYFRQSNYTVPQSVLEVDSNNNGQGENLEKNFNPVVKFCEFCSQKIGKVIRHECNKNSKAKQIAQLVSTLDSKNQAQIASKIIKNIAERQSQTGKNNKIFLSTGGTKRKIIINPKQEKKVHFSKEIIDNFQNNANLSQTQMGKVCNLIRVGAGKNCLEPHLREHISEKSRLLESYYQSGQFELLNEKGDLQKKPVVFADAETLITAVIEKRNRIT